MAMVTFLVVLAWVIQGAMAAIRKAMGMNNSRRVTDLPADERSPRRSLLCRAPPPHAQPVADVHPVTDHLTLATTPNVRSPLNQCPRWLPSVHPERVTGSEAH
jgi:hypothetical protein